MRVAKVKVLGSAPRVQLELLSYLEILLFTMELLDEVLLIVVDAESEQVNWSHAVAVDAVVQLVDEILRVQLACACRPRG